ncbi:hypothetical protein EIP86_005881 [Pleurotus ostreatoroseus]|nr:hypothetical protein EIP86_005881 [Pleurotus ostreatoroseus]
MSNSAWRPNEASATIHAEAALLQGSLIMCIAYGAVATLSIQCFTKLIQSFKRLKASRAGPLLAYVVLIFILSTMCTGASMLLAQRAFVDDRDFPGGPLAYEIAEYSLPIVAMANDALLTSAFLSDGLLLWRCTVVFKNSAFPPWASYMVASAFWFAEFVNIIATAAIVGRLYIYRRRLSITLDHGLLTRYTGMIPVIIESELLYTAFMILFIVPLVRGAALVHAILQSPALVQVWAHL